MERIVQKIPFLRISLAFMVGILSGRFAPSHLLVLWILLLLLLSGLIMAQEHYNYRFASLVGIGIHLVYIIIGILIFHIYNQKPLFYRGGQFTATVLEMPREKTNSFQSLLKVDTFHRNDSVFESNEKIMVFFAKNDKASGLIPGERLIFNQSPQFVSNYNNPYEFDYKSYLKRKKIYRQVYLSTDKWLKINGADTFSATIFAERLRRNLLEIYRFNRLGESQFHILSALTLGYKGGLDRETRNIFASAGVMHILAVSGLHVGIIFMVISLCFGFMRKKKSGRLIFIVMVICGLWFYALLTGLSPSVSRAAMMFSCVAIGNNIKRPSNIYNTLAASAFFLLLINPNNLFEPGFQLSYSAVFGIVFLQPRFEKLFNPRCGIMHYCWVLFTVSLAAQITTFPLSAYYFNTFPVYFWISNLFVIPFVTVLIPLGFVLLTVNWTPLISGVIAWAVDNIIGLILRLLELIEKLPFSEVSFSLNHLDLFFTGCLLFSIFIFMDTRKVMYFKLALFLFLMVLTTSLVINTRNLFRKEIIVYNYPDDLIVHLITGKTNYVISSGEFPQSGYMYDMVMKTVMNLRIDTPVFLSRDETFKNDHLYSGNNFICFEGRIFQLDIVNSSIPENISPEIIIGAINGDQVSSVNRADQLFVITHNFKKNSLPKGSKIYCLHEKGAFREKW